jgi:hypothetical protein
MKQDPRKRMRLVTLPQKRGKEADVRWSRIAGVRSRIASGYYDRAEVRERLLDTLMDELAR